MRDIRREFPFRLLIGGAAFIQAIDMAIIYAAVFSDGNLQLPFFAWMPIIPVAFLPAYIGIWAIAALAFAFGRHYYVAGSVLVVALTYALLVDQQTYSNHLYLLITVIVISMLRPVVSSTLLRWQLSIVYFFAAVSKINIVYISGIIIANNLNDGWLFPFPDALVRWEIMLPIAVSSICVEVFLAVAFWSVRHRPAALVLGTVFHLSFVLLFPATVTLQLSVFGLTMGGLYLCFVAPDAVERHIDAALARVRGLVVAPAGS